MKAWCKNFTTLEVLFSKDEQEIIYPYSINHGKWFFKYLSFGFLGFIHLLYHLMEKIWSVSRTSLMLNEKASFVVQLVRHIMLPWACNFKGWLRWNNLGQEGAQAITWTHDHNVWVEWFNNARNIQWIDQPWSLKEIMIGFQLDTTNGFLHGYVMDFFF